MTVDEIKNTYSMRDIVERYGFHPNRAGFISCPFHSGDNTPSLKVYAKDFHCHACGANGDIFTFVQKLDDCDFKTAFYSLGGFYDKPSKVSEMAKYHREKAKEKRGLQKAKIEKKIELNNSKIDVYREWIHKSEPLSDVWCDCLNAYIYCLYVDEVLREELKGGV